MFLFLFIYAKGGFVFYLEATRQWLFMIKFEEALYSVYGMDKRFIDMRPREQQEKAQKNEK